MSLDNMAEEKHQQYDARRIGANWATWKFEMEMVLIEKVLWDVTRTELTSPVEEATLRKQHRAKARIALSLDRSEQLHIRSCASGAAAWNTLCSIYDAQDQASQLTRRQQFLTMSMSTSETIQSWISRVKEEALNAKDIGCSINEDDQLAVLIHGLTDTYRTTRKVLLGQASVSANKITWDQATKTLIANEASETALEGATAFWSNRNNGKKSNNESNKPAGKNCFWCGKLGHWEHDCRQKMAGKPRTDAAARQHEDRYGLSDKGSTTTPSYSVPVQLVTFSAQVIRSKAVTEDADWFLDFGTNEHQFLNRADFITYSPIRDLVVRTQGKDQRIAVAGRGTAVLRSVVDGRVELIHLPDALHVPDGEANLISFGRLLEKGARIELSGTTLNIYSGNRMVMIVPMKNRMWPIRCRSKTSGFPLFFQRGPSLPLDRTERLDGTLAPKTRTCIDQDD